MPNRPHPTPPPPPPSSFILHPSSFARPAFTLVELLVVVGLIALLLALLLPALNRARATSARVACSATLRQYALVNQMYLTSYRDWYLPVKWGFDPNPAPPWPPPPAGLAPPTIAQLSYPSNPAFRSALGLRIPKTSRVPFGLICPRAVLSLEGATKAGYDPARSYGYNSTGLGWYTGPTIYYTGWKRHNIHSPATKLMFADATDWVINQSGSARWDTFGEAYSPPPIQKTGITAFRHEGGANIAFWDGHVAWLPKKEVVNNAKLWASSK